MSYRIAGVDVHKKMLAVVVSDVEVDGEYLFERRRFGSNPEQLRLLAAWLLEQEVEEVMESTAQYWKPVWEADRPTGPGDGQSAQPAPGCSPATGGGARSGRGLGTTDQKRRKRQLQCYVVRRTAYVRLLARTPDLLQSHVRTGKVSMIFPSGPKRTASDQ